MNYQIEKDITPPARGAQFRKEFLRLVDAIGKMEVGNSIVITGEVYIRVWSWARKMYPHYKFVLKPLEIANENGVNRRVWRVE